MATKRGFCPTCEKRLSAKERALAKDRCPEAWADGSWVCHDCSLKEAAAEDASLDAAESGRGLEQLCEVGFYLAYGE